MKILVTGAAGFIGFHSAARLVEQGAEVIGVDNLDAYYSVALKRARLAELAQLPGFRFVELDLADRARVARLFETERPARVVHLAAQAGVRHGMTHPHAYADANLVGFLNILEGCRNASVGHLVFASSSSVYGANTSMPFRERDNVDHPLSLYAATKKSNELMAHAYAHLYAMPVTGLRFFTVYGPWGRPDMAVYAFTRRISEGQPIDVFNHGRHARDFTYVSDVVGGVALALERVPAGDPGFDRAAPDPATSPAPYRIYNIGNSKPVELMHLIACLERELGRTAQINFLPMQPGDVETTFADMARLEHDLGYRPRVGLEDGIACFVAWFRSYHGM